MQANTLFCLKMWSPLTALTDVEYQHLSQFPGDDDTPELAEMIRLVASRPYADQLAVVTSMWIGISANLIVAAVLYGTLPLLALGLQRRAFSTS
ncbi:MAG: hypothetical protein GY723_17015 [bacterium]|nr:hypothetical protein [bacterium]